MIASSVGWSCCGGVPFGWSGAWRGGERCARRYAHTVRGGMRASVAAIVGNRSLCRSTSPKPRSSTPGVLLNELRQVLVP